MNSLNEFIEIEKLMLAEKFDLNNPRDWFRITSTFRNSITYSPVMFFGNKQLSSDVCKAEILSNYYSSVVHPKVNFDVVQPESCKTVLDDFDITVSDLEFLLRKCDDSLSTGPDNIPSFFLEHPLPF